jgi:hypothetical protein
MFRSKNTGRILWLQRRLDLLSEAMGFDVASSPALVAVVSEIQSGSDIKAAQIYTQVFSCTLSEAMEAVADLKQRVKL